MMKQQYERHPYKVWADVMRLIRIQALPIARVRNAIARRKPASAASPYDPPSASK